MEQKSIIANNLSTFRKHAGLTQQELADKLNYTDKAVSKWERGEAIPDVLVLKQIADFYGVTLNDIISETSVPSRVVAIESKRRQNVRHLLITLLSVGLVFMLATIAVVVFGLLDITYLMLNANHSISITTFCFMIALPIAAILLVIFSCIWGAHSLKALSVSALIWMICLCFDQTVPIDDTWLIYFVGAAVQVLAILWYLLLYVMKNRKIITTTTKTKKK